MLKININKELNNYYLIDKKNFFLLNYAATTEIVLSTMTTVEIKLINKINDEFCENNLIVYIEIYIISLFFTG